MTTLAAPAPTAPATPAAPTAPALHRLPAALLSRAIKIVVVGAGGSGSEIVGGLVHLHQALVACGHPEGLAVTIMDGDVVSESNCVRQPFHRGEVGLSKAVLLAHRANQWAGCGWTALPLPLPAPVLHDDGRAYARYFATPHPLNDRVEQAIRYADVVVSCVDSRAARALIVQHVTAPDSHVGYLLDLGNGAASGQVLLGQPRNQRNADTPERLPIMAELWPESIDASTDRDTGPSCSAAEALARQEPFTNRAVATIALSMLARFFRHAAISYHGAFVDTATGLTAPIRVRVGTPMPGSAGEAAAPGLGVWLGDDEGEG